MSEIEIQWPNTVTADFINDVHRIATDIAATGEPTGFGKDPRKDDVRMWGGQMMAKVKLGDAILCAGYLDGVMQGFAVVTKARRALNEHSAELGRIMTHPSSRGLGLAGAMVDAIVERVQAHSVETIILHIRGNNQGGIAFFETRGFTVCGRIPDVIEVGDDRFDEVIMYMQFPAAPEVRRHGSDPGTEQGTARRAGLVTYSR